MNSHMVTIMRNNKMIEVNPCAKINLGLNITERRSDGYHNLETVFYPIPIYDSLSIEVLGADNMCNLKTGGICIDGDAADNLVVKAYKILCEDHQMPGVDIRLVKNIPTQAGLGGGSADCAFTITALNKLLCLNMSETEMMEKACRLGADCAFFVSHQPSYATGIGEQLTPIEFSLNGFWLLLVKPDMCVSTKEAFSKISPRKPERNCKDVVLKEPVSEWRHLLVNDFEYSIFPNYPLLQEIKSYIYEMGASYSAMSGSGSSLFGIFEERPCADVLLRKFGENIFVKVLPL